MDRWAMKFWSPSLSFTTDVNECNLMPRPKPCHDNATCTDLIGENDCTCNAGFSGDGVRCDDIDECAARTHQCHASALCTNTIGSYTCQCHAGYRDALGDGRLCRDQNECRASIRSQATDCDVPSRADCVNTEGSYRCTCRTGYEDIGQARTGQCLGELNRSLAWNLNRIVN